jgi:hypothetical protein
MKQHIFIDWEREYQETSKKKGKKYFELENTPRQIPWFQNYRGSSYKIKLLTRIRTDHYLSNKKLKLFKQKQTENCETCNEVDDINHFFFFLFFLKKRGHELMFQVQIPFALLSSLPLANPNRLFVI